MLPLPSKLLKTWSGLTRWVLGGVMVAWLLLGLAWGTLHWLIVPRIDQFRPQLEAWATRSLGVPVRVGTIEAQSQGAVPSFVLNNVTLMDAQGREALRLPRVWVALSARSVLRMGFEQVVLDQPNLEVRRLPDGRVTVAGLDMSGSAAGQTGAADWFFSQVEFVIRAGVLHWRDELRGVEPLTLQHVDLVVRNSGRHHDLRLDATPPQGWGSRLTLMGKFTQPLLTLHAGRWQDWDGQLFATADRLDVSALNRHVDLGVSVTRGRGAVRAWVDVNRGQARQATVDVLLPELTVTLGPNLAPLDLRNVHGRLGGQWLVGGFDAFTQNLRFDTADGLHWPGGNVHVLSMDASATTPPRGELQADQLDLAALSEVAQRLPLQASWHERLLQHAPKGAVDTLAVTWQGTPDSLDKYSAKGRISQLELQPHASVPGVQGVSVNFDLNEHTGKASLKLERGWLDVPDHFQDSRIDITELAAQARWQVAGEKLSVQVSELTFSNPDAQGQAQFKWETSDPAKAASHSRFPGVLDLQATLSRAEGTRVHRYLPNVLAAEARAYVRDAILAGTASNVRFAIKGDLADMPASSPQQGTFKVTADVRDGVLAFVPRTLQGPKELPWPTLTALSGRLVIDRQQLLVKAARAKVLDLSGLQIAQAEVSIADLRHTEVKVSANLKGPLTEALRVVNGSPLGDLTGRVLAHAVASGSADLQLKLTLPVAKLDTSTVQGALLLSGNDLHVSPDSPKLSRARGTLNFTQAGLSLAGVQARMLGGDVRLEGGLVLVPSAPVVRGAPTVIRATGTATAEGLRQASELGWVTRLAHHTTGAAPYSATLGWRRGVMELWVNSNLQGLALGLPAPLTKSAQTPLAFRLQTELIPHATDVLRAHDRLTLSMGTLAHVVYERDMAGASPTVLRGAIGVGLASPQAVALPASGVIASVNLPQLDVDAWESVLGRLAPESGDPGDMQASPYLPTTLALRSDTLTAATRQFHKVVVAGTREGPVWRANVTAQELSGFLEYREGVGQTAAASAGRLYARLAKLTIAPSSTKEVEDLLASPPLSVPALDIVVDDFELRGKRMGRLEVEAVNRATPGPRASDGVREWRLSKLNLSMPEATFTANGNWARVNAQGAAPAAGAPERRRTVLNFKLDIADGGALLTRFGMKDVVRQASGKMEGQVAWLGSPLRLDYPSLGGAFTVNMASGQFLKADPGLAKLLGVLSLQSLPRRLTLDFRDVFSEGFSFDFVRGDITVTKGIARTNNLQMKGLNAAVLMDGLADIDRETQDLKVVVVPEINAGSASLIASVINPAVGLGTFLAELFLRRPLTESTTQEFHVDGSWADPQVTKVVKPPVQTKETTP